MCVCVSSRANSTFLQLLCDEIPCSFLVNSIPEVSNWFSWLDRRGAQFISEVYCKDQFSNICPSAVAHHLTEASEWLGKHRKWRMTEIEWCIHKDVKKLDRPGRAKADKFWYISHTQMPDAISFEMHCNNYIRALRKAVVTTRMYTHGRVFLGSSSGPARRMGRPH